MKNKKTGLSNSEILFNYIISELFTRVFYQELKDKLHSCQIEKQLLREEIKNKQKTINKIMNF